MTTIEARYVYSSHKTRDRAEDALEDMFASGDVCEGERPMIEARREGGLHPRIVAWQITLPM